MGVFCVGVSVVKSAERCCYRFRNDKACTSSTVKYRSSEQIRRAANSYLQNYVSASQEAKISPPTLRSSVRGKSVGRPVNSWRPHDIISGRRPIGGRVRSCSSPIPQRHDLPGSLRFVLVRRAVWCRRAAACFGVVSAMQLLGLRPSTL